MLLSFCFLASLQLMAQSEIGLVSNWKWGNHDDGNYNNTFSARTLGLYYANRIGRKLRFKTQLNWTQIRRGGYFYHIDPTELGMICFLPKYDIQKLNQVELVGGLRYDLFRIWGLDVFSELELAASSQMNDQRENMSWRRHDKEVLSYAMALGLGARWQLAQKVFVDFSIQRRRYWRHDGLEQDNPNWYYTPGIAVGFQLP